MFRVLFSVLLLSAMASASLCAQNPQQQISQTRELAGTVLSESSQPISEAEVLLLDSTGTVIKTATTSEAGGFALVLTVGQSYIIQIRKLGHQLYRWESGKVEAGNPMSMPFVMQRVAPMLDTVSVRGAKGSALTRLSLSANEIDPKRFYSAAGAVIRLRPMMLGDHLHECGVVREIYVNGVRRTPAPFAPGPSFGTQSQLDTIQLKAKMTADEFRTFMSLLGVLDDIRAGDVQEIRYANCWDRTVPIQLRDAIFVTLKPGAKLR